jgi:adenine/guanine phosphoribosyltransferase-like PRPP-binding protein
MRPAGGDVVGSYTVTAGSQSADLDLIALNESLAIALLMTIDESISFVRTAGSELATRLAASVGGGGGAAIDVVVSAATLGIQVGTAVAVGLGLDRQVVLQKTKKIHLRDALREPLSSITTGTAQDLLLDRRAIPTIRGKNVVFVDDVISSGSSCAAALRLIRAAGGNIVGVGAILVEGGGWKTRLGHDDAELVTFLGKIPLFRPTGPDGAWEPDWNC